jgi:hypothetical protein
MVSYDAVQLNTQRLKLCAVCGFSMRIKLSELCCNVCNSSEIKNAFVYIMLQTNV